MRAQTLLCYLIAGWSGFFVMAVELLGGRLLAPTFGSSIYVWGAIITVFMLALSLGYLAGGRYSMRSPSVRRLGTILVVAALTVLPLIAFGDALLDALSVAVPDPRFGSLLGASLLFFVPTFFSGMVSPYAVRLLVQDREVATVGAAGRGVDRGRAGRALAAAEQVGADDEEPVGVDRLAGSDEVVPPAAPPVVGVLPRGVVVPRQRVADEDDVVALG